MSNPSVVVTNLRYEVSVSLSSAEEAAWLAKEIEKLLAERPNPRVVKVEALPGSTQVVKSRVRKQNRDKARAQGSASWHYQICTFEGERTTRIRAAGIKAARTRKINKLSKALR